MGGLVEDRNGLVDVLAELVRLTERAQVAHRRFHDLVVDALLQILGATIRNVVLQQQPAVGEDVRFHVEIAAGVGGLHRPQLLVRLAGLAVHRGQIHPIGALRKLAHEDFQDFDDLGPVLLLEIEELEHRPPVLAHLLAAIPRHLHDRLEALDGAVEVLHLIVDLRDVEVGVRPWVVGLPHPLFHGLQCLVEPRPRLGALVLHAFLEVQLGNLVEGGDLHAFADVRHLRQHLLVVVDGRLDVVQLVVGVGEHVVELRAFVAVEAARARHHRVQHLHRFGVFLGVDGLLGFGEPAIGGFVDVGNAPRLHPWRVRRHHRRAVGDSHDLRQRRTGARLQRLQGGAGQNHRQRCRDSAPNSVDDADAAAGECVSHGFPFP